MKEENNVIEIKDMVLMAESIMAITKGMIPASYTAPECYTLGVYLYHLESPIIGAYNTVEERDADYEKLKEAIL